MKKCNVNIEAFFGIPFGYENWYEDMEIELTDEQFERYLKMLEKWKQSDEWKKWDMENGEDFFYHISKKKYPSLKEQLYRNYGNSVFYNYRGNY